MADISKWKNKNRKILREPVWLPKVKKLGKKLKKIAEPFVEESVWINKRKDPKIAWGLQTFIRSRRSRDY